MSEKFYKSFYEKFVPTTDVSNQSLNFYIYGMFEETGELAGVFKRMLRGDYGEDVKTQTRDLNDKLLLIIKDNPKILLDIAKEIGDRHWYTTRFLQKLNLDWNTVEEINVSKLSERKKNKKIKGKGDNR